MFFLMVAYALSLISFLEIQDAPEVKSDYFCAGAVPTGPYEAKLHIEKVEQTFHLTWSTTEVQAKGLALRDGNDLAVIFVDTKNQLGVILYRITAHSLEGKWTGGNGLVFTETCTLGRPTKV